LVLWTREPRQRRGVRDRSNPSVPALRCFIC